MKNRSTLAILFCSLSATFLTSANANTFYYEPPSPEALIKRLCAIRGATPQEVIGTVGGLIRSYAPYARIKGEEYTALLIKKLGQRFTSIADVDIAVLLKTPGTEKWLENYVRSTGEYELFERVQEIISRTCALIEEGRQLGIKLSGGPLWPKPFPADGQSDGLMIQVSSIPDKLITPWGTMLLLRDSSSVEEADRNALLKKFLETMETSIKTTNPDSTLYAIEKMNGQILPTAEYLSGFRCKNPTTALALWEILSKLYKKNV